MPLRPDFNPWLSAHAQVVKDNLGVTNGKVNVIALAGNTIYIGGKFTRVGTPTGPVT